MDVAKNLLPSPAIGSGTQITNFSPDFTNHSLGVALFVKAYKSKFTMSTATSRV